MSRRILQILVGVSALQALLGGGIYLWFGVTGLSMFSSSPLPIDTTDSTWSRVDYMYRAFAGTWFVLGAMLAYMVPSIEKHSAWFSFACAGIFAMGVGRFLSLLSFSPAVENSTGAMFSELVMPPILVFWQRRVAHTHG